MEREKVKLKTEYKDLVRAGNISEADKKLRKYWKLCGINKPEVSNKSNIVSKKNKKYDKKFLETLSFKELKKIGLEFGTTDRSKKKLIQEILNLQ